MPSLQKLSLVALAISPVVYGGCLQDLQAIDPYVVQLGQLADNWSSSSSCSNILPIQSTVRNLISKINQAKTNADAISSISVSEATTCYNYLCLNNIYPHTVSTLSKTEAKVSQFSSPCGYRGQIRTCIDNTTIAADKLADRYIQLAPTTDLHNKGVACKANFDAKFKHAHDVYS